MKTKKIKKTSRNVAKKRRNKRLKGAGYKTGIILVVVGLIGLIVIAKGPWL